MEVVFVMNAFQLPRCIKLSISHLNSSSSLHFYLFSNYEQDAHTISKASSTKAFGHASDNSTMKDLNKFDIPRKLINASKREYPSHLNNVLINLLSIFVHIRLHTDLDHSTNRLCYLLSYRSSLHLLF